jgi:hypothetical protein
MRPIWWDEKSGNTYSCTIELGDVVSLPGVCKSRSRAGSWQHVPTCLEVSLQVRGYVAARLLDLVHDEGLVHHVPLPERNELLQVVGQELAADIYPVKSSQLSPRYTSVAATDLMTASQNIAPPNNGTM